MNTRPESIVMLEFKITDKHGIDIVFETEITKLPEGAAGCSGLKPHRIFAGFSKRKQGLLLLNSEKIILKI